MSCDCNDSAFTKLRECWSRHHKTGTQGECDCCGSGSKSRSKVKGKFGIAYVINTPNRKCKPCGWEVEFNDTLSEVENNCKKMMNWVTCPPLGECQNNQTNMCCCPDNARKLLNAQPPRCQCTEKDNDLCRCCQQKKKKSVGDGCCKKEKQRAPCCCVRPVNRNQCSCLKANEIKCCSRSIDNNKNQCCCKAKNNRKCSCCRAQDGQTRYMKSIRKCAECCCKISNEEKIKQCYQEDNSDAECCCNKTKKKPKCCCQSSESESSLEYEEDDKRYGRKDCSCDCVACKCNKKKQRKQEKKINRDTKEKPIQTNKPETKTQQPKNLQRPEPKKERHKNNEKTPFTLVAPKIPMEEPDTGQEHDLKDSYIKDSYTLHQIAATKKPKDESIEKLQKSIDSFVIVNTIDVNDKMPQEETAGSAISSFVIVDPIDENDKMPSQEETTINAIAYQDENIANENIKKDTKNNQLQRKKNRSKQPTLLQKIQKERKKEMDIIHPKKETTAVAEEQAQEEPMMNISPEIHAKKRRLHGPKLLKKIKQERKKEVEAIHGQ